jgi:hypothetical protein
MVFHLDRLDQIKFRGGYAILGLGLLTQNLIGLGDAFVADMGMNARYHQIDIFFISSAK